MKFKRLIFGERWKEYSIGGILFLCFAIGAYLFKPKFGGDFLWQALLGIFAGLFVGYVIDNVETWYRHRSIAKILSKMNFTELMPVIVADLSFQVSQVTDQTVLEEIQTLLNKTRQSNDEACFKLKRLLEEEPYRITGPGESVAIGLMYSAYSALCHRPSKPITGMKTKIMTTETADDVASLEYTSQRFIFGGPRYNRLTEEFLKQDGIPIYYPPHKKDRFESKLQLKDSSQSWTPSQENKKDFGLVIRLGNQIHISGCLTWGVAGAAKSIFTETPAYKLVLELRRKGIDPISDDFWAVIICEVPDPENDDYSIGKVSVEKVGPIKTKGR